MARRADARAHLLGQCVPHRQGREGEAQRARGWIRSRGWTRGWTRSKDRRADRRRSRSGCSADAVFVEHPNLGNASGTARDRATMAAGVEAGRAMLARRHDGDRRHVVTGPTSVVTRTRWEGEAGHRRRAAGPAGTVLAADVAMFVELDADGRILRQENYDCYLPPSAVPSGMAHVTEGP